MALFTPGQQGTPGGRGPSRGAAWLPTFEGEPSAAGPLELARPLPAASAAALRALESGGPLERAAAFAAAVAVLAGRYARAEEVVVVTRPPRASADSAPVELPIRVDLAEPVAELRRRVRAALEGAAPGRAAAGGEEGARPRVGCLDGAAAGGASPLPACELTLLLLPVESPAGGLQIAARRAAAPPGDATVARLLANLEAVLGDLLVVKGPQAVGQLRILCDEERRALAGFNPPPSFFPRQTIDALFHEAAASRPGAPALIDPRTELSYGELAERAGSVARALVDRGVKRGDRVALVVSPGWEAVAGMLGVLGAGACYVPVDPRWPEARKRLVLEDAGCALALTSGRDRAALPPDFPAARAPCVEELPRAAAPAAEHGPADLAYVMYTSGTTGRPKGVLVEHAGVVRLVRSGAGVAGVERVLLAGALEFDASTFEIWGPLLGGGALFVPAPGAILSTDTLGDQLARRRITLLMLTAPLFAHHARAEPRLFRGLGWLYVVGSVLHPGDAARVRAACPGLRLVNGYGPTENSCLSTAFELDRDFTGRVPIGAPIANSSAFVLDRRGDLQPIGAPGDLWVGGAGVARGYLGEESARFVVTAGGARLYRTGDLARWLPDGTLDFLGREDDQLKIRGHRVEPGEVAAALLADPAVHAAAIVPFTAPGGDPALCAYLVAREEEGPAIRARLARQLPDFLVPSRFLYLERLPLTAAGKLDRAALPRPEAPPVSAGAAPEERVAALWRALLGVARAAPADDFFAAGGDSLLALRLLAAMRRELGVEVTLERFFEAPTLGALAAAATAPPPRPVPAGAAEPAQRGALSVSQQRLAELYERDPESAAFNASAAAVWPGPVDLAALRQALAALARRHEALRTSIRKVNGRWVQEVAERAELPLEHHDLSALTPGEVEAERRRRAQQEDLRPFRLERGPLHRLSLTGAGNGEHDLVWTAHHALVDGWSLDLLHQELAELYRAFRDRVPASLPEVRAHARDHAAWQREALADPERSGAAAAYWARTLAGARPVSPPLARPGPHPVGGPSAGFRATMGPAALERLRGYARSRSTTPFLVLLAAFHQLLSEASGRREVLTGIPSANRSRPEFERTVGFLADSLIVTCEVVEGEPFAELVRRTADRARQALEHAWYPIELACAAAGTTWPALLTTFFNVAGPGPGPARPLGDPAWRHLGEVRGAKMPLVFYLTEHADGVAVEAHYQRDLLGAGAVEELVGRYLALLERAARSE